MQHLPGWLALGAVLFVLSTARHLHRRRTWVQQVRDGRVPGWKVVFAEGHEHSHLPPLMEHAEHGWAVLVRVTETEGYRRPPALEPVAFVSETPDEILTRNHARRPQDDGAPAASSSPPRMGHSAERPT